MNRIGILLLIVLVWSCGGSGEDAPTPLGNGLIDRLMQTYRIKDTVGLSDVVVSEKEDYHYLVGKKSGKFWLAQYDKDTKEELYSFVDTEGKFKFTETVDVGFGEKVEYKVDLNPISIDQIEEAIGIACVYREPNRMGVESFYYIIDNNLIKIFCGGIIIYSDIRKWFNNSIMFYTRARANASSSIWFHTSNAYLFDNSTDSWSMFNGWGHEDYIESFEFETALPISMFEYIYCNEYGTITRKGISPVHTIWSTQVKAYSQEAKYEFKLLDNTTENWKYKASVILFDGTKDDFEFTIDINTGVIQ